MAPGRGPPGAFAPVPTVRAAELASLKQSSPPTRVRDYGAATPAGAGKGRHEMARVRRQKRRRKQKDGSSITNVEDDRGGKAGMTEGGKRHEMTRLRRSLPRIESGAGSLPEGEGFLVWHLCRGASVRPRTGTASSGFSHHRRHRLLLRLRSRLGAAALPWRCESTVERTSK